MKKNKKRRPIVLHKTKNVLRNKAAKKAEAVKKTATTKPDAAAEEYRADFEAWQAGKSLAEIARAHGVKRRDVRKAFNALAGGKDAVTALRAAGAGGKAFGGKRATGGGRSKVQVAIDDSKVPHTKSGPKWTVEREWVPAIVPIEYKNGDKGKMLWRECRLQVFVSPKGERYVQATAMEKADLIVDTVVAGFPPVRLRKLEKSAALKKVRKADTVIKQGQKAHAAKKKAKKQKKAQLKKMAAK